MRPTTTASNLFRRALCPGSARMEQGLPEEDSELSRQGQLLHDYAAHTEYERSVLKPKQRDLLELAESLTKEVIDAVEREQNLTGKPRVDFREQTWGMEGFSGTPDFVRYYRTESFDTALVIDAKFGYAVVESAELNLQLRAYAVIAARGGPFDPQEVFVAIVQPRAPYDQRKTIAHYTSEDIEDSRKQIVQILEASQHDRARLVPGEEQCRYCKAKMICPAFREMMMVPAVITPDKALSKAAREQYLAQRLSELNDGDLEKTIVAERLAKMIHDPLYDEARKRIANGSLTNFSVAKDSEVRDIVDVRKAMALLSLSGLDRADIYGCVTSFSVTKLTDTMRKKHPNWTWQVANDWVNKKLQSVIELTTRKGRVIRK